MAKLKKKEKKDSSSFVKKTLTPKSKKKVQMRYVRGVIHGKFSFNNTILSLAKENGDVLRQVSSGSVGFKNTKKATPYAAQKCSENMAKIAYEEFGMTEIELCTNGIGSGRDVFLRRMMGDSNFSIVSLIDKTPVAYGGCRARKQPRK